MRFLAKGLAATTLAAFLAVPAMAQNVSLWAARIGAEDVEGTAEFYKAAFGMQEVDRLHFPSGEPEIILNFGGTLEEAEANPGSHLAIMPRAENETDDPVPPLMLHVDDIEAVGAAVTAAGGTIDRGPFDMGASKLLFISDPAGNGVELIQPPAADVDGADG